jgi:hypothetical protein
LTSPEPAGSGADTVNRYSIRSGTQAKPGEGGATSASYQLSQVVATACTLFASAVSMGGAAGSAPEPLGGCSAGRSDAASAWPSGTRPWV